MAAVNSRSLADVAIADADALCCCRRHSLLWRSFASGGHGSVICVPVLIMAAGQLAGGLAWLTISGRGRTGARSNGTYSGNAAPARKDRSRDGRDRRCILSFCCCARLRARRRSALVAFCGIALAASSATMIQLWFRSQAKRSNFRRRHTSSRIATFAEAFSSITWAATGAIAAAGSVLALFPGGIALLILVSVRRFAPRNSAA